MIIENLRDEGYNLFWGISFEPAAWEVLFQ